MTSDELTSVERRFVELAGASLPLPAGGRTLQRWRRLAEVAAEDLALVKLYESHTDALAILAELDGSAVAESRATELVGALAELDGSAVLAESGARWAVWAAEPPDARLSVVADGDRVRLRGRKAWCSGVGVVSHALVTGWNADGRQQVAAVRLGQAGITAHREAWQAPGMSRAGTADLVFDDVPAMPVGRPGQYTDRPGFWHGGCGIAACWYGGTLPLARAVLASVQDGGGVSDHGGEAVASSGANAAMSGEAVASSGANAAMSARPKSKQISPHAQAHLGAIDLALCSLRALLTDTAAWLDANPAATAAGPALRLRGAADATARLVLDHAGRALGAGPLCRDPSVARHFADLPIFIRQTHAERDLAELGGLIASETGVAEAWQL